MDTTRAICHYNYSGPRFGHDIFVHASDGECTNYNDIHCKKQCYEKKIRDTVDNFSIGILFNVPFLFFLQKLLFGTAILDFFKELTERYLEVRVAGESLKTHE
ncbi:hypothetical protein C1646_670532 [Rhizophagus diaphanus]|nr:hypothetical protein C1646_670532 [Rhizophagus diaphanus] [Rhizophagus sp. MUCL 43196]